MQPYDYIQQALNALAIETKKGGVTSGRVANLIRYVLERAEGRIQELESEMQNKADIVNGRVPMSQLPEGLDDMQEYPSRSSFPAQGSSGILYMAVDTGKMYRWSGSTYGEVSNTIALGETSSTAYPGNKGAQNAQEITRLRELVSSLQNLVSGKADASHTHEIEEVIGLVDALAGKAESNHNHSWKLLSDADDLRTYIAKGAVAGIGRDGEHDDELKFIILRGDGTSSDGFSIFPVTSEGIGLMTPAMLEKLWEIDNKADSEHTHNKSQIDGLTEEISGMTSSISTNKTSAEKNAQDIEQLRIQLQGKIVSKTFATMADAEAWMRDPQSRRQLLPGSNIWIEDENEDDWWVAEVLDEPDMEGSTPTQYYYRIKPLKVEIPVLEGYAKKEAENTFTEKNTFTKDVTIEGATLHHGLSDHFMAGSKWRGSNGTEPETSIDNEGVKVWAGGRNVTYRGKVTSQGVGGYRLSGRITEEETLLSYDRLEFSVNEAVVPTITRDDFREMLSVKNKQKDVGAPVNLYVLFTNYSQGITFDDLKTASKLYCEGGGKYHDVHIITLQETDPISTGAVYYEEMTSDGLVKYIYSLSEVDGTITTAEPTIVRLTIGD